MEKQTNIALNLCRQPIRLQRKKWAPLNNLLIELSANAHTQWMAKLNPLISLQLALQRSAYWFRINYLHIQSANTIRIEWQSQSLYIARCWRKRWLLVGGGRKRVDGCLSYANHINPRYSYKSMSMDVWAYRILIEWRRSVFFLAP